MIEKIYSRRRIRMPKMKFYKLNICILIIIIIIIGSIASFVAESYPIFKSSCVNAAASRAVNIVNEEVQNAMQSYTYDDLIQIEKDENENVTLIKANTLLINRLISEITGNLQKRIDGAPTAKVYINYGSVSGISILKNLGPQFEIELESAGSVDAHTKSEFQSTGVNQSLHRIFLEINTEVNILTPLGTFAKEISPEILLTEAVIVGKVPESYYNLEGLSQTDTLETLK